MGQKPHGRRVRKRSARPELSPEQRERQYERRYWVRLTLILFFTVLVPTLVFFVAPLSVDLYDESHVISVTCRVESADAGSHSTTGGRGGASSGSQVVIESSDCGTLLLREGVNATNADEVAAEIAPGGDYRFRIGLWSYEHRDFLGSLGLSPRVFGFKRL